jgi:hypothetical protein
MFYKNLSFKIFVYLLGVVFLFQFCKKKEVMTDLEFRKQLLAGSGTYQNVENNWKLDSTYINGVSVVLTPYQKTFVKTFTHDGIYKDSELNTGTWELPTLNTLRQKIKYSTTSKIDSFSYEILIINTAQLKLKLNNATSKTEYLFKIAN